MPFPIQRDCQLDKNVDAEEIIWLQEEHKNQGHDQALTRIAAKSS